MSCSSDFLTLTNTIYDECAEGISTLNRIIVGSPSALVDRARTALIPTLYAFWERFFRMTLAEYLRAITIAGIPFSDANVALGRLRVRKAILGLSQSHREELLRALDNQEHADARLDITRITSQLRSIEDLYKTEICFTSPDEWVSTEANVAYKVVEKNFVRLGLNTAVLKQMMADQQHELFSDLKQLVDLRNGIAHGTTIVPTSAESWDALQSFVSTLMNSLQLCLYEALEGKEHLRHR